MTDSFSVTFEDDHILVISDGDKDMERARVTWSTIAEHCQRHQCYKVLGIANSRRSIDTFESLEHVELFNELGIDARYRVAWVEKNPDAYDAYYFTETVVKNRNFDMQLFDDVGKAKAWLLGDDDS